MFAAINKKSAIEQADAFFVTVLLVVVEVVGGEEKTRICKAGELVRSEDVDGNTCAVNLAAGLFQDCSGGGSPGGGAGAAGAAIELATSFGGEAPAGHQR